MYFLKKTISILFELFFAQIIALKNREFLESISRLFSFLRSDFRKDELITEIADDIAKHKADLVSINGLNGENDKEFSKDQYRPKSAFLIEVKLLTTSVQLTEKYDWNAETSELEDSFFLHRFSWILILAENQKIDSITFIAIANHWVENNKYSDQSKGWDSYSISERICNLILLMRHFSIDGKEQDLISASIVEQLSFLMDHLEFRGSATNNHLFNNGRALYIGGSFLMTMGDETTIEHGRIFQAAGKNIIEKLYHRIFSDTGMNREGSSHYQLIFTKWLLEILWTAHYISDSEMVKFIKKKSQKAVKASCFFLDFDQFPFIGDISPDFDIGFFKDLGKVSPAIINGSIFEAEHKSTSGIGYFLYADEKYDKQLSYLDLNFQSDGYHLIESKQISMLFYINPNNFVGANTHAHSDIGSFILWYQGKLIFDDRGRSTYKNNKQGDDARSIVSHNGLRINNSEPIVAHNLNSFPELHTKSYLGKSAIVYILSENSIAIRFYGYSRHGREVVVSREFSIGINDLLIKDCIEGYGYCKAETFFHLGSNLKILKDSITYAVIDQDGKSIAIIQPKRKIDKGGEWIDTDPQFENFEVISSKRYGSYDNKQACVFKQKSKLPIENMYKITFI